MSAWQIFALIMGGALIGGYIGACLTLRWLERKEDGRK